MTEIINGVHIKTRLPLNAWVFAALATFVSLASSFTQVGTETYWRMAELVQAFQYASLIR